MDTIQTDSAKARLYLTSQQLSNMIDNLHAHRFGVQILDDGQPRDVTIDTVIALKIMLANVDTVLQGL